MVMQQLFYLLSLPSFNLFLSLLAGFVIKLADQKDNIYLGLFYGFILFLIISFSNFASLFVGAIFAQIFAKRIDTKTHFVSLFSLFAIIFSNLNILHIIYFFFFAYLDEIIDSYIDKRFLLDISALLFFQINPYYFFSIILFDSSYIFASYFFKHFSHFIKI